MREKPQCRVFKRLALCLWLRHCPAVKKNIEFAQECDRVFSARFLFPEREKKVSNTEQGVFGKYLVYLRRAIRKTECSIFAP